MPLMIYQVTQSSHFDFHRIVVCAYPQELFFIIALSLSAYFCIYFTIGLLSAYLPSNITAGLVAITAAAANAVFSV